jgi:class 3 adenylate cyclase
MDTQPGNPAQRTLASIMFTDVVAFSKLASQNEERTFRALNRDFGIFYRLIERYQGEVLNTMGDGMMVVFLRASDCASCALEMQQALYEMAASNPPDGVLEHRLGLHIGEIFINGKNTMGDGVNQAARIQALAKPNAIAMSRDFYDIVKGQVNTGAKYLGPQMAKNIPVPIPIFEVPSITEEMKLRAAEALFKSPEAPISEEATGRKSLVYVILAIVLIGVALLPLYYGAQILKSAKEQAKKDGRVVPSGSIRDDKKALEKLKDKLQGDAPKSETSPAPINTEGTAPAVFALTPDELKQIEANVGMYDYSAAASVVKGATGAETVEGQSMVAVYEGLATFKTWLQSEVNAATGENPISLNLDGQDVKIFSSKDGVVIETNGQSAINNLWGLKPDTIYAIAQKVTASPHSSNPVPPEAARWLLEFKTAHRL